MVALPSVLNDGFGRFHDVFYSDNSDLMRLLVEKGQHPHTCVIACCDSRVDPALLFNAAPGDLFVIRAIASHIPRLRNSHYGASVLSGLYYAVSVLGVKHLVILGHSECGGIKAVVDNEDLSTIPNELSSWLQGVASLRDCCSNVQGKERYVQAEKACLIDSYQALKGYDFIDDAVTLGSLTLHACYFDLAQGTIASYDETSNQFADSDVLSSD